MIKFHSLRTHEQTEKRRKKHWLKHISYGTFTINASSKTPPERNKNANTHNAYTPTLWISLSNSLKSYFSPQLRTKKENKLKISCTFEAQHIFCWGRCLFVIFVLLLNRNSGHSNHGKAFKEPLIAIPILEPFIPGFCCLFLS